MVRRTALDTPPVAVWAAATATGVTDAAADGCAGLLHIVFDDGSHGERSTPADGRDASGPSRTAGDAQTPVVRTVRASGPANPASGVAAAIRALPAGADALLWLGDDTIATSSVTTLVASLVGHAASVRSQPVIDAVKRVDGGAIIGGVDRAGLVVATGQFGVRAGTAARLLPVLDAGTDPIAALAALRCAVAVQ